MRVIKQLRSFLNNSVAGIGIGAAGQIGRTGEVLSATDTFKDWKGINIKERIEETT